jgi:hypothetical protein
MRDIFLLILLLFVVVVGWKYYGRDINAKMTKGIIKYSTFNFDRIVPKITGLPNPTATPSPARTINPFYGE